MTHIFLIITREDLVRDGFGICSTSKDPGLDWNIQQSTAWWSI